MVRHECGFRCRYCPCTSLAIESDQVTLQSYPEVCLLLSTTNIDLIMLSSLIHKLMASTIRTGAVTSVVAVMILITYLIDNESNGEPIWK